MSTPRRWVDDPDADEGLRDLLRDAPLARPLDAMTRRRLGAKAARVAALPAATAGWLFVKSAAAALGVVLGSGAIAVSTGLVDWSPPTTTTLEPAPSIAKPAKQRAPRVVAPPAPLASAAEPPVALNPSPSLPLAPAVSASGTLSAEAALLEQARRDMRSAPSRSLSIAADHARRFPRGQLTSERTMIQIEALKRLGRDAEARELAQSLLSGASGGLYAERVERLLGPDAAR